MTAFSARHFAVFRGAFGAYLALHFGRLVPYAPEIFGRGGIVPQASLSLTAPFFPNVLALIDTPLGTRLFTTGGAVLAVIFMVGRGRPWICVALWYMWACLLNRNVFIVNPGIPFVGWLLLASALMPEGEPWAWRAASAPDPNWHAPPALLPGAWLVMALAYSVSGIDKLASPSWLDGSALKHVLESPIARPGMFREALLGLPAPALRLITWAALSVEVLFAPLCLTRPMRAVAWTTTLFVHCGVLLVLNLAELTVGVLMFHAFTLAGCGKRVMEAECRVIWSGCRRAPSGVATRGPA